MAGFKSKKKAAVDKITEWPVVTKGSHLTVTTYENGRTELQWNDGQLQKDVQEAIAQYEKGNNKDPYPFDWR